MDAVRFGTCVPRGSQKRMPLSLFLNQFNGYLMFCCIGWSVLLGKKELKAASKQLRDMCCWQSDVPSILSACLISLEPDSNLRIFTDQYTPDERFGQTASNCQLSTPKDASCTHILVFPTSAKAQVSLNFKLWAKPSLFT